MRGSFLIFSFFYSVCSFANAEYSQRIWDLQRTFENSSPRHTIVYIDRVDLAQRIQNLNIENPENPKNIAKQRNQAVSDYISDRIHVALDDSSADLVGDYFDSGINVAVPIKIKGTNKRICVVFGAQPESTAQEESERMLYWKQMQSTSEYQGKSIQVQFSKKEFALLADLHETFHCLDPYYTVKQETGDYENQATVHRAESYAEIGALLYLAQQGYNDLAMKRALYRIVGSFMVGRHQNLLGPNLYENIHFGVVYSFYPALFTVQKEIDGGSVPSDLLKIQQLAHEIVESYSFRSEAEYAIYQYQRDPNELDNLIQKFKNDKSEYFRTRFQQVEIERDA
ncbi:MAG: hypothetical protein KDD34_04175, partial [Bdellovibrionales bacterium]|nr:hypothetical protein [Bdellovibrionales bacterium]